MQKQKLLIIDLAPPQIDYRPGTSTEGANAKSLRETLDKLKTCIIVLAAVDAEKVTLIAGISDDLTKQVKADELVNWTVWLVGLWEEFEC